MRNLIDFVIENANEIINYEVEYYCDEAKVIFTMKDGQTISVWEE